LRVRKNEANRAGWCWGWEQFEAADPGAAASQADGGDKARPVSQFNSAKRIRKSEPISCRGLDARSAITKRTQSEAWLVVALCLSKLRRFTKRTHWVARSADNSKPIEVFEKANPFFTRDWEWRGALQNEANPGRVWLRRCISAGRGDLQNEPNEAWRGAPTIRSQSGVFEKAKPLTPALRLRRRMVAIRPGRYCKTKPFGWCWAWRGALQNEAADPGVASSGADEVGSMSVGSMGILYGRFSMTRKA
jgi:hypothetical protein